MSGGDVLPGVCTDWRRHDVPDLWQMLANEDGQHSWDQVTGWRQISELLTLHGGRLRAAREQLAASWPERGSQAASVFLAFVDQLLDSMDGTATVAAGNSVALAGITTSLGKAREAVKQLHNQWQTYAEAERQNNRPMIRGASPGVLEPRPPQDWRQELNQQGATVMAAMENEVLDYAQSTTVPEVYVPAPVMTASGNWTPAHDELATEQGLNKGIRDTHNLVQSGTGSYGTAPDSYQGPILSELPPSSDHIGVPQIGVHGVGPIAFPTPDNGQQRVLAGSLPIGVQTLPIAREPNATDGPRQLVSSAADETPRTPATSRAMETPKEKFGLPGPGGVPQQTAATVERARSRAYVEHEWRTARGVPSVLEPSKKPRTHRPEPGVIGIDR